MTQGRAWQIAQVQRLVDMSRRDIQRACYDGKGGVGILRPHDSTWGRRSYDEDDLAELFVVARLRRKGLSLPEIRRQFDAASDRRGMLDVEAGRLYEAWLDATAELLRAVALRTSVSDALPAVRAAALARLFDMSLRLSTCAERLWADGSIDGVKSADDTTSAGAPHETPHGTDDGPSLTSCIEDAVTRMRAGAGPDDPSVQRDVGALVAHVDAVARRDASDSRPCPSRPHDNPSGTRYDGTDGNGALDLLERTLDMPGVDLVLELWLGAGAHERLCEAVVAHEEVNTAEKHDGRVRR